MAEQLRTTFSTLHSLLSCCVQAPWQVFAAALQAVTAFVLHINGNETQAQPSKTRST